jgi:RNA polymerase sigma-70 factor (ECF subfamily)
VSDPSDESLLAAHLRGDPGAFGVLVTRHERRIYGLCLRILGNREDAEDATQEAFLAALRKAGVAADPGVDLGEAVAAAVTVQTALTKVPEEFRVAVVLCDLYRVPYADAAQILEVPVGTVKSRVFRGRAALAACLAGSGNPDPPLGVATPPGTDPGPATSEPTGPDHPSKE